ncbi:MAG: hypothetical protein KF814_03745 [Nitrospiraceae bacterium]|nr:hypothetical protein [Nitrospiraceae bacterium]
MRLTGIMVCVSLLVALPLSAARADDPCLGDEEQKNAKAAAAALKRAEQAGKPGELFVVYRSILGNDCIDQYDKSAWDRAKANVPKLGRELAKAAEAKGLWYSSDPVRSDGQASAFQYFEAIGEYGEANRVMLKALQAKADDLALFKVASSVDHNRWNAPDSKTGQRQPFASPPAYRQELQRMASSAADRLMKAEEQDAKGLSGSGVEVGMAAAKSLEKLRTAAQWMAFLPGGDKSARERAEQRGDTIIARSDSTFTQANAAGYYKFAGSSKANEKAAQLQKKIDASRHAMEKSGEQVKGAIKEQSQAEQRQFDKKKGDLEKELGF